MQKIESKHWQEFKVINANRRSIRDFDQSIIPDQDIKEILMEANLAPSSANVQPYQFHWIKSPQLKSQIAKACNGQRAASTASTLIVVVASTSIAKKTIKDLSDYVDKETLLTEKSKKYNRKIIDTMSLFLKFAPIGLITPLLNLSSLFLPSLSILPLGDIGIRQWAAKNSIFAVQNLLLATVAKGYDACPMEGFNAAKIASILKLPYGSVIPVIIAIGKKTDNAHIEPQWRRSFENSVVVH